jgi:hypothetical protein
VSTSASPPSATTVTTLPPYAASTGSSSTTPNSFPTTAANSPNSVATREAAHIPAAQATSPVKIDNASPPVTVQQAWNLFNTMPSAQRKEIQQQMFDLGLLTKQSDVSGDVNPTSLAKWKDIVTEAAQAGTSIQAHLDTAGTARVYSQIATDLQKQQTSLQNGITAPKSLTIPLTNDAVLRSYLEAGFTQALGHAPSEQQLDTFVSTFHNQEVSAGETQLSEPRQYDQEQLSRVNNEMAELKALGPNGLDAVVSAYGSVMGGENPMGMTSSAPSTTPLQTTLGEQPSPLSPRVTTPGGVYALSPQAWATGAKEANIDLAKYPTPTSAPVAIQTAVLSHLLDSQYAKLGNWADAVSAVAGGNSAFGAKVASEVNDKLKGFTNTINAPGPDNIVASATADTSGVAAKQAADQAAKESDPVGYYAHQISLYEGLLNRIAGGGGGLPQQDITASTVSGPVAPIAAPVQGTVQVGA